MIGLIMEKWIWRLVGKWKSAIVNSLKIVTLEVMKDGSVEKSDK